MATGARSSWVVAPWRAFRRGPTLAVFVLVSIAANQCQASGSTAAARHQQQATSQLASGQESAPHPTTAASLQTSDAGGGVNLRKSVSEKAGSQQAPRRTADKMARRMEAPELTIEDEPVGDSFLTTEEAYEGATSPGSVASEEASSSFAPDYEPDGDTVLEMTTTSVLAPPRPQTHRQQPVLRPLRQLGGQQRPGPPGGAQQQQPPPTLAPGNHRLAAVSYQPTLRSAAAIAAAAAAMPMPTGGQFNVNMGADRMMIKPHQGRHQEQPAHTELATESIQHEMRAANHHHQLLYPPPADFRHQMVAADGLQLAAAASSPVASAAAAAATTICYTPLGLLLVIMLTMLITILVCFATHYLLRQLGRRQFDLIANSKHFESKHRSGYLEALAGNERRRFVSAAAARCAGLEPSEAQLFQHQLEQSAEGKSLQRLRDEHGCAFDNPYFRDEQLRLSAKSLARPPDAGPHQQQPQQPQQPHQLQQQQQQPAANGLHQNEQLNFIEHHISNLHNRQVTSSVKELSVLGSPSPHVVDLTNELQRAKVLADPKEGDLVAVDITGHDFIGLGFDLCGGHHEGIFVRSVLSRGPARESGAIQPGDRIKCLNISFDQMTLQDATDILNSGSPYKLRLLLEKRATGRAPDHKLRQPPAPILMRRNHRYYGHPPTYLGQNYLMAADPHHYPQPANQHQRPQGLFKSYLRRLAQFVAPAGPDYGRRPLAEGLAMGGPDGAPPYYLGSNATNRRHLLQGRGSGATLPTGGPQALHLAGHLNSGYGSDGDDDNHLIGARDQLGARRRSVGSLGAHRNWPPSRQSFDSQHRHMFGAESQTELNDMSLDDYQHRNAHHKLHGPQAAPGGQLFERPSRYPSQEALRAQSDLEQTRSQPEIARGLGQEGRPTELPSSAKQHQASAEIKQHHSTPAMNLLSDRQDQWAQTRNKNGPSKEESVGSESSFADSTSKLVGHQRRASSSSAASSSAAAGSTGQPEAPASETADRDAPGKLKENSKSREETANKAGNSRA